MIAKPHRMTTQEHGSAALVAGGFAAILASACCLGPLLLVSIGLGGAWMSKLQVLEPYRPLSIAVAVVALLFAYRSIYRPAPDCAPGDVCAVPGSKRAQKLMFRLVAALVLVALGFPYVVPLFY